MKILKGAIQEKHEALIVFDDIIADVFSNKSLTPIVNKLPIRGRKRNVSLVYIKQSNFKLHKDVRLNCTHQFVMKIPNKRELQKITIKHSSDIDFEDFIKIYTEWTGESYSLLFIDKTLTSDDPLRFRKDLLKRRYNKLR